MFSTCLCFSKAGDNFCGKRALHGNRDAQFVVFVRGVHAPMVRACIYTSVCHASVVEVDMGVVAPDILAAA